MTKTPEQVFEFILKIRLDTIEFIDQKRFEVAIKKLLRVCEKIAAEEIHLENGMTKETFDELMDTKEFWRRRE